MKILMLTTEVGGRGGVQYAGRLLLRALSDSQGEDCRVVLVTLGDRAGTLPDLGSRVEAVSGNGSRLRTVLLTLQRRGEPWDLVILGHVNLAPLVLALEGSHRQPLLTIVYGLDAWRPLRGLRKRAVSLSNRICYISEHSRTESEKHNPWLAHIAADVCHLGLLPEPNHPAPMQNGTTAGHGRVSGAFALSVGRMSRAEAYKGHEELIRIWPQVEPFRPGLSLVMIGDGDDRLRLEALARSLKANVSFLGAVDDPTRDWHLRHCRCFCLPSRGEGLGLVYLEAMRCGKAVLAGATDAGREVVVDGVTGRSVDAQVPGELLQGVLDVTGDGAEGMGRAGRDRFDSTFSYAPFLKRFSGVIENVMGRPMATLR